MKKRIASILIAAAVMGMSVSVWAAPSISEIIPEAPQVNQGNLSSNQQVIVQNANTGAYVNKDVAKVVEEVNNGNTKVEINKVLTDLKVDTNSELKTEKNQKVNPTLYETITPFIDLAIQENNNISFKLDGEIEVTMTVEAVKGMDKKDLLILVLDPETGAVQFVSIDKLNKETGEVTATFSKLGAIAFLEKSPLVTKEISPENYENEKVKAAAAELKDKKDLNLKELVSVLLGTEDEELVIGDKTININDYVSPTGLMDIAIAMGDEYHYNMSGEFDAKINKSIADIDWQSMVSSAFADFDVEAAAENPESLVELGEFTVDGSFLMQMNPVTGEAEYVQEPTLSFAYPEAETEVEEETAEEEAAEDENALMQWTTTDKNASEEYPNLVIEGTLKTVGPCALFLNSAE